MKTLYLDCQMGAAGDMLTAALYELLSGQQREEFHRKLQDWKLPGVEMHFSKAEKCGIVGTHFDVTVCGEHEHSHDHHDHDHEHHDHEHHDHEHHDHEHHHHEHHHSTLADIGHIVSHLPLSETVKENVLAVYRLIAEAESHAHGKPVEQIHFHEVGTLDAIADVSAVCLLMEMLAPRQVIASPVHVGAGQVHCAHGILPVPAPATAHILRGVPMYGGEIQGELCTPTGAALLKHFVTRFGAMPQLTVSAVGYGMGTKDFPAANCVRALLGEQEDLGEQICRLECNVDDMTGEELGFAMEKLYAAGAVEVFTVAVGMKKSRPGILLQVLCREADKEAVLAALFGNTTTIGVRESSMQRYVLARRMETCETIYGPVRKKCAEGYGVVREKWEYEDIAAIARREGLSLQDVVARIERS